MRLIASALLSAGIAVLLVANGCGGRQSGPGGGGSSGSSGSDGSGGAFGSGGSAGSGGSLGSGGSSGSGGSLGAGGSLGSGGGAGSGGSDGSPIDSGPPSCPDVAPSAGDACFIPNLVCEYGSSPDPYCNSLWQCDRGSWKKDTDVGTCPPPGGTCPSSFGSHAHCSDLGTVCPFPDGTCVCSNGPGPVEVGGPSWSCVPISKGCSVTRPKLGSPCSDPGRTCDYGACLDGIELQCIDGFWGLEMVVCAS